jgi:thiosulfate dehydrogenase [quinone] large subunit
VPGDDEEDITMSSTDVNRPTQSTVPAQRSRGDVAPPARRNALSTGATWLLAALRLSVGWIFLWAFLDKTFGLGFATERDNAWIEGGSPTTGYLSNVPTGPFADFYNDLAGQAWVDWLFQIGLLAVGVAVVLGIGLWVSAVAGGLLLLMMWTAVLPPENNPFMDDHIVYALVLFLLAAVGAGRFLGIGAAWERLTVVQRAPWLK